MKLYLSDKAERALLDEWGFEGYSSIMEVLTDREELEGIGYDIDEFAGEVLGLAEINYK